MAALLPASPSNGIQAASMNDEDHLTKDEDGHERPLKRRKYVTGARLTIGDHEPQSDGEHNDNEHKRPDAPLTPSGARSTMQTRPRRERPDRYAPPTTTPRPRYSNSASAAAASQASDGYKPREERSWEDFHPDLDINANLLMYTADEVDGRNKDNPVSAAIAQLAAQREAEKAAANGEVEKEADEDELQLGTPIKRKPGRPSRRPESMLSGLGSPPAPRIIPLPTHNPKERLNLPKPSFRHFSHFLKFEQDQKENSVNYVDRSLASIGFQESDRFDLPSNSLIRLSEAQQIEDEADVSLRIASDAVVENGNTAAVSRVEYDMDEQDEEWLSAINELRKSEGVEAIRPAIFEITMTQIEKEYHALEKRIPKPQPRHAQMHRPRSSSLAVNGDPITQGDEPDSKCAICDDGDCENANAIIFCDGCDLAVHQECYGVPFIPEGQWFCRRCKEVGRGTPSCIFCPNVDGAFKQTTTLRWSHLLCAIWIPEVTIANPTFMEPITDVEKVPKGRWKLNCYICHQKMGACIQCSNKNCYLAFHVTCARRAKLFLKMKSQHQSGIDTSALKAFCDKHVPPEWRRIHDTDHAIIDAKRWYRHAMKEHRWAENSTVAQELGAPPPPDGGIVDALAPEETAISPNKRKRNEKPKVYWRLPSGAPIVPAVVYDTVDVSLGRFAIRRRKEYVEKACRYWTLKREARRGASLLKRLQLQLESFSSMEITRRNFVGLSGREKLERRIAFAEILQEDMKHVVELAAYVKEREELKMEEIESLRTLVDTVYFPIPPLLWPILERAQKLDEKTTFFSDELSHIEERLHDRYYTSVSDFARDLGLAFSTRLNRPAHQHDEERPGSANDQSPSKMNDIEALNSQFTDVKTSPTKQLTPVQEQKQMKAIAKRIIKAVKESFENAARREAELRKADPDEAVRNLDSLPLFSADLAKTEELSNGIKRRKSSDLFATHVSQDVDGDAMMLDVKQEHPIRTKKNDARKNGTRRHSKTEPLSPPTSTDSTGQQVNGQLDQLDDDADVFTNGGIPWYLKAFNPVGTTIESEVYTGRKVLRDMSEELSDMDEDTLTELGVNGNVKTSKSKKPAAKKAAPKKKSAPRQQPRRSQRV